MQTEAGQISEAEWDAKRLREREDATHPCDHYRAGECMCDGACSCHWRQPETKP